MYFSLVTESVCPPKPAGASRDWFECVTPDNQAFCYHVTESNGTQDEQKQACRALHAQADLAVLNTKETHIDCVSANNATIGKLYYS